MLAIIGDYLLLVDIPGNNCTHFSRCMITFLYKKFWIDDWKSRGQNGHPKPKSGKQKPLEIPVALNSLIKNTYLLVHNSKCFETCFYLKDDVLNFKIDMI